MFPVRIGWITPTAFTVLLFVAMLIERRRKIREGRFNRTAVACIAFAVFLLWLGYLRPIR